MGLIKLDRTRLTLYAFCRRQEHIEFILRLAIKALDVYCFGVGFVFFKSSDGLEMASIENIALADYSRPCNMIRLMKSGSPPNSGYASRDGYCHGSGGESLWLH